MSRAMDEAPKDYLARGQDGTEDCGLDALRISTSQSFALRAVRRDVAWWSRNASTTSAALFAPPAERRPSLRSASTRFTFASAITDSASLRNRCGFKSPELSLRPAPN